MIKIPAKLERCVKDVMATGKDRSSAFAICNERLKSKVKENVNLNFSPEFVIKESESGKTLSIGGIALTEGVSKNKIHYRVDNLQENHNKDFKWLVGHPAKDVEDHVIGKGKLTFEGNNLMHDGIIMNTARHPDVIEKVKAGLLGPSIHATAGKITEQEGSYIVEGLSIDGVGLVAFQGVKNASIDYAIAESFKIEETDLEESDVDEQDKDKGEIMEEPKKEEIVKEEEPKKESISMEELKILKEEIEALKSSRKEQLVESILKINKDFKKESLMEESDEKLKLIMEYETKLSKQTSESAVVESDDDEDSDDEMIEEKDGSVRLSEKAYSNFNKELIERIR